jgi:hypothetical protein
MAQDYNTKQQYVETPNNYCQPELLTRGGMREGSVVEDAVERSSWGKSRCEEMCRFPNTGGLHHTSGGAPLETVGVYTVMVCRWTDHILARNPLLEVEADLS